MRINVYAEEITKEVELAFKTAETGKTYGGVRFYLESSDKLHHTIADDDRSAVTFWAKPDKLHALFQAALQLLESETLEKK